MSPKSPKVPHSPAKRGIGHSKKDEAGTPTKRKSLRSINTSSTLACEEASPRGEKGFEIDVDDDDEIDISDDDPEDSKASGAAPGRSSPLSSPPASPPSSSPRSNSSGSCGSPQVKLKAFFNKRRPPSPRDVEQRTGTRGGIAVEGLSKPSIQRWDCSDEEQKLRQFDLEANYGPCVGITRLHRWRIANSLGLRPPNEVHKILTKSKFADIGDIANEDDDVDGPRKRQRVKKVSSQSDPSGVPNVLGDDEDVNRVEADDSSSTCISSVSVFDKHLQPNKTSVHLMPYLTSAR